MDPLTTYKLLGTVPIGDACSQDGCVERPIALAPWRTSQMIFLCQEHADEILTHIAVEDDSGPLTGIVRWIVPTCQTLVGGTTPCGAASTCVSVFVSDDGFETSCMCDRHSRNAQ